MNINPEYQSFYLNPEGLTLPGLGKIIFWMGLIGWLYIYWGYFFKNRNYLNLK